MQSSLLYNTISMRALPTSLRRNSMQTEGPALPTSDNTLNRGKNERYEEQTRRWNQHCLGLLMHHIKCQSYRDRDWALLLEADMAL